MRVRGRGVQSFKVSILQELQCDASAGEVADDDVQLLWVGLGVEVSEDGDAETLVLLHSERQGRKMGCTQNVE